MADIDYRNWDWLPTAANEISDYLKRLLTESGIRPHDVTARAKSIESFQRKWREKDYRDPLRDVTDTVAVRIITYSKTDLERSADLIRARLAVKPGEDRNPGDEKAAVEPRRRGYDCRHLVVAGEAATTESGWIISGGSLARYFERFGGLEIQIRTVAAHAWAEFEHARRYKGASYRAIGESDRETIDQLFGAASDARRSLDETFVAIDRILANPAQSDPVVSEAAATDPVDVEQNEVTPVDATTLTEFLTERYPNDGRASDAGLAFAVELVRKSGLQTIEALQAELDGQDDDRIKALMDMNTPVTQVRRLDDSLLARFGEDYIDSTGDSGNGKSRAMQLRSRFDLLRGKVGHSHYFLVGLDVPDDVSMQPLPAARTVREFARIVANRRGVAAAEVEGAISGRDDLPTSARAKQVTLDGGGAVWVATNLRRDASERLFAELSRNAEGLDVKVMRDDGRGPEHIES
ncbi:Uncharacterized protein conserved in bacteria (plasmid) [Tsukamurella tyrosinosolvens]|uniref:PpGpp synthetase catalytic domain-containing protein (RelA/SpoT-type nucleotidyltranferase) n=1 Tax=Tsukamurella tyrosinosolvens TaxID=57704 RepID=A0A1H4R6G3_TSUTY|nr:hypothetical protein [Tsukamurella tyrosinosolvens]KXO91399.1 hypothetical protein AXK58_19500 [Tsukamurella tyrosinosolvens]SEC27489.1 ppGpp synthetase catalytic domain-containing protein (RelA/SpoT-type nucleotidyltranferase) [Tsukamurella tyrosinosolvens]VEH92234.1 Uncharacterized protein conserved in bacteria [Tsukamurella tyrosinosolvens]